MEVHHHAHTARKKWTHYLWEFLMLFLAVFCGFLAENIREHSVERHREKEYIESMIEDLKQDTSTCLIVSKVLFKNIHGEDSLIDILQNFKNTDSINKKCYRYFLKYTTTLPEAPFSDRTISQLLNAGNMRLIKNQSISDSIINYYNAIVRNAREQQAYYKEQFNKTFEYAQNIYDLTYLRATINENYEFSSRTDFKKADFKLLTTDLLLLKKYEGNVIMLQNFSSAYVYFLKSAHDAAKQLILLLKKEYHFE